jgi:hypothetical protein
VSTPTPPLPHTNGNGNHTTVVQAGIKLGSTVVTALSPNFLALICINILFLGTLYWFVDARARHTSELLQQLLTVCLKADNTN